MTTVVDERRVFAFEIRETDAKRFTMTGLAAPYGEQIPIGGNYLEVLEPGVFKKSIREAAKNLPLLAWHNNEAWPVGRSIDWTETDAGLVGVWEFADTEQAREAWYMAAERFCTGLSVGFQPIISDVEPGSDTKPSLVRRREARLVEVSMVPTPAYPSAQITLVRTAGIVTPKPRLDKWKAWRERLDAGKG